MGLATLLSSGWDQPNECFLSVPGQECNGPSVQVNSDGSTAVVDARKFERGVDDVTYLNVAATVKECYTPEMV